MKPESKRKLTWAGGAAAAVLFVAALIWGPWIIEGHHLRENGKLVSSAGIIVTGFRTMLVAIAAGAIGGVGLWYTHKKHDLDRQQLRQTQDQFRLAQQQFDHAQEKDREQAELAGEGQVTERYVEASKLLSSDNLTERLCGIYAFERIMRDSEKDHGAVVNVLATFIRQTRSAGSVSHSSQASENEAPTPPLPEDAKAALTVLCQRPQRAAEPAIDLSGTDLANANLEKARLPGANLEKAILSGANLSNADLSRVQLSDAKLAFANLRGALLVEAHLSGTDLSGAELDNANLASAWGPGIKLPRAYLSGTNLTAAYLPAADFTQAHLNGTKFTEAYLPSANFCGTFLMNTDLSGADLSQVDLSRTRLYGPPI
ncbi:pentapeptide repeat-containing protein [Streptomyces violaceus]|uniref:Pentapeptide repeat-containing protein n=1 Tax=Streptomyces violaceus TaxID=1936 RepID=A0ABY9U5U4_STRVL|nr:pentapeptide repeat-containing protein [Streptomyces janthinus]WND18223.1 pentapeptide repeat-containing protein [Streptomyces janthinus]